jgi:hypothetical protein
MRIKGLKNYRGRNPHGYFSDLASDARRRAYLWLHHLCKPWGSDLPSWRLAILIAQAKRLALTTPEQRSKWGRTMLAKRGGYAVQRTYRAEGRTGPQHPAHKAAGVSACQRAWRKREREDAERRERLGLPPKPRVWHVLLG